MTQGTQQATQTILATEQQYRPIDVSVPERAIARNIQEQARKEQERQRRESEGLAMLTEATKGIMPVGAARVSEMYKTLMDDVGSNKIDARSFEFMRSLGEIKNTANEYKQFKDLNAPLAEGLAKGTNIAIAFENGKYVNKSPYIYKLFGDYASTGKAEGKDIDIATANQVMANVQQNTIDPKTAQAGLTQLSNQLDKIRSNNVDQTLEALAPIGYAKLKATSVEGLSGDDINAIVNEIYETQQGSIAQGLIASGEDVVGEEEIKSWIRTRVAGDKSTQKVFQDQTELQRQRQALKTSDDLKTIVTEGEFKVGATQVMDETYLRNYIPYLTGETKEGEKIPEGVLEVLMKSSLFKDGKIDENAAVRQLSVKRAKDDKPKAFTQEGETITVEEILQTGEDEFIIVGAAKTGQRSKKKGGIYESETESYDVFEPKLVRVKGSTNKNILESIFSGSGKNAETLGKEWREQKGATKPAAQISSTTEDIFKQK